MLFDPAAFYTGHSCIFFASLKRDDSGKTAFSGILGDFTRAVASSQRFPVNAFAKENLNLLVHSKQSASLQRGLLKGSLSTCQSNKNFI